MTLNFSEPVTLAGGNLKVTLDTGAVVSISPFSGATASGTYIVQTGQTSSDLNVMNLSLNGGATLKVVAGNDANLALPVNNLANNANIIVNPAAPTTVIYTVNMSTIQRSRLTTIELNFSNPINAATLSAPSAITLTRTIPNDGIQVDVTNGLLIAPAAGTITNLTLTFSNTPSTAIQFASLADGRWRLSNPSLSYQSSLNDPNLRRLYGDSNNDGTIDGNDLADFGVAFGSTGISPFDFNNDGTVDALDFGEFGNRFGVTM